MNTELRVIPILTVIEEDLVKTTNFKNPAYVGDPLNAVRIFNDKYVDELVLLDIGTNDKINYQLIKEVAGECFMPLTYGGGINSVSDAEKIFKLGVEKISVNRLVFKDLGTIKELIKEFGSSSLVLSVDIIKKAESYFAFDKVNNNLIDIDQFNNSIRELEFGEILVTSVDMEGSLSGPDYQLAQFFSSSDVPVIYNGGISSKEDIITMSKYDVSGVAAGAFFVYYGPYRAVLIHYPNI